MKAKTIKLAYWSLVRPGHRRSDLFFLVVSIALGSTIGYGMAQKTYVEIGLPFGFFAVSILYFMWRNPGHTLSHLQTEMQEIQIYRSGVGPTGEVALHPVAADAELTQLPNFR
ncbi:hypothetical protein ALP03_200247 [Pseudomonas amygdali pv. tabaci]|uniref:Uncharacterized protein n=1 Tax=Pseudomonas amygdali pv. tabaci TaxID=322 RepID=A0A3M6HS75_PSEAJ|nr:hypothetical protein ALP03_200247 [Pseudomonas amygdali pv. tabaci]